MIKQFIQSGRGFLGGHDTMWSNSTAQNTRQLRNFANIKIGSYYEGNYYYPTGTVDFPSSTTYPNVVSGNQVQISKKGLLTSYPWDIGSLGTVLDVPISHTTSEFAYGDVWMKYAGKTETLSPDGLGGTNNFYLTTWNNTAQIQTGHSNGEATPDEQKILANTLFYLAQVTDSTSWDDHKGQDLDSPTKPNKPLVTTDIISNKTNITFDPSTDIGTTYDYYVEATGKTTGTKTKSEIKTTTITSGLKGYSIVVDQNPDTVPSNTITTTSNNFTIDKSYSDDFYVHIAAIDNAGNMSEVSTHKYSHPTLTLTPSTTSVTSDPVTITAAAGSTTSEIEKIQTPDGNWVNSSTTDYVVSENGTYSFTAIDKDGFQTTQSITVSNIVPKVVLNIEPEKDKIHLNENVSALLTMDNIKEIAAEDVRIKYDSTKLQFLGCNEIDGIKLVKNDAQAGELRFILVSKGLANVVNSKKSLLKLNFKGIAPGDALVDITKGRVSDGIAMEKNLKDAECGQAIINVSDKELIDVNNDGDFSLLDLAIDGRHYGEDPSKLPEYNTDVVINGAIDDNDFSEIVKLMLKNPNYNF